MPPASGAWSLNHCTTREVLHNLNVINAETEECRVDYGRKERHLEAGQAGHREALTMVMGRFLEEQL